MRMAIFLFLVIGTSCQNSNESKMETEKIPSDTVVKKTPDKIELFYSQNKGNDSASISTGSTGNGKLINGKLLPFSGPNYQYFDTISYLGGRAFVNDKVKTILLETYEELEELYPDKIFYMMETSNKNGGNFFPHKTHQNGLSTDLMTPMLKNGNEYAGLDKMGIPHYWIEFDENGKYIPDSSIRINFNLVAQHVLLLDKNARKYGYRVSKVLFKNDLHDELFVSENGKLLRKSGIQITTGLSKTISNQHDDHFHVDFVKM